MPVTAQETAAWLERGREARRREGAARASAMRSRLHEVARLLRHELAAKEVWLFGSVARGDAGPDCDLDIAVSGLSAEAAGHARGRLSELLPWEVDLVRLEAAPPSLAQRIHEEGERL